MMSGEGTEERKSYEVTSPSGANDLLEDDELLPWDGQKSDGEDDARSSQYSSCGESEFERYCSANSVMGTPSFCSSVYEFPDSDYGSFKSLKLGGESSVFKSFGVDRKLSSGFSELDSSGGGSVLVHGKMGNEDEMGNEFQEKSEGLELDGKSEKFRGEHCDDRMMGDKHSSHRDDSVIKKVSAGDNDYQTDSLGVHDGLSECRSRAEDSNVLNRRVGLEDPCLECDEGTVERCLDDDGASSRHEYSEGEESMFGCDSDGEQKCKSYFLKNGSNVEGLEKVRGKHDLFMTSDVTYGLSDWDDFIQETGGRANITPQDVFRDQDQHIADDHVGGLSSKLAFTGGCLSGASKEQPEDIMGIPMSVNKVIDGVESAQSKNPGLEPLYFQKLVESEQGEHAESSVVNDIQTPKHSDSKDLKSLFPSCVKELVDGPLATHDNSHVKLNSKFIEAEDENRLSCATKLNASSNNISETPDMMAPQLPDSIFNKIDSASSETKDSKGEVMRRNHTLLSADDTQMTVLDSAPLFENHFSPYKRANAEHNGFFDEMVHEMEEILLDTATSPGFRSSHGNRMQKPPSPLPSRDGGSTASTSGTCHAYPVRIKDIEVIGARQKTGDVSLSERLVGVKEYTIYKIRVWSGEDVWEIERRYRDFLSLYRMLKKLFADKGWILPAPWLSVEQESKKIFGSASPDVIKERSILMQECLRSVIDYEYSTRPLNAIVSFLWPSKSPGSPTLASAVSSTSMDVGDVPMLGKTVSLVVQIHPYKPIQQILDAQCHCCAGCRKSFNFSVTRMKDLARTLGWGKPRLCDYSGQLFCSTCHTNDTAVLPAKVLHLWDFSRYPVSQLARSYLESIYDKPMLCVSAVNPILFSRVPALHQVTTVRKRIGAMIPYVRCSFRRSIYNGLGSRRYLLESNDFFALRDLIDLSKGMFAALPVTVETISRKILEHITEQCLICCDTGIPCNARQACNDPSSLIFPFQEGEIERCRSCNSVFHRHCFSKIVKCPCGSRLRLEDLKGSSIRLACEGGSETWSLFSTVGKEEGDTSGGIISSLLSKVIPQRSAGHKDQGSKENDTVILMGALPSNTL